MGVQPVRGSTFLQLDPRCSNTTDLRELLAAAAKIIVAHIVEVPLLRLTVERIALCVNDLAHQSLSVIA